MGVLENWLNKQVAERRVMPFKFANKVMLADGRSAVFWVEHDLLIVSDLHLEKGSFLGQFANPIPHYDSRKTLYQLSILIEDYQPSTVVCLGDSFHDKSAFERMWENEKNQLSSLIQRVNKWVWILGNHDPALPNELEGCQKVDWEIDGILLSHEPEVSDLPQIIGHFHPKASVKHKRLKLRGRSLLMSEELLIMPAFGQYTGGLDSGDAVLDAVLGSESRSGFVLAENKVFPFSTK